MMNMLLRVAWALSLFAWKVFRRTLVVISRPRFALCGRNVLFNPFDSFDYSHIKIGNDVFIGSGAVFHASMSGIIIGNKVMFGPQVMILGGDHNTSQVGRYMFDVKEKLPENDQVVVIEDDVWVGARSIILKGVTIGTGSIIAAGSVVTRTVPPYSIAAGVPARVVKPRFSDTDIQRHKVQLRRDDGVN